jgi:hypothetical protein
MKGIVKAELKSEPWEGCKVEESTVTIVLGMPQRM